MTIPGREDTAILSGNSSVITVWSAGPNIEISNLHIIGDVELMELDSIRIFGGLTVQGSLKIMMNDHNQFMSLEEGSESRLGGTLLIDRGVVINQGVLDIEATGDINGEGYLKNLGNLNISAAVNSMIRLFNEGVVSVNDRSELTITGSLGEGFQRLEIQGTVNIDGNSTLRLQNAIITGFFSSSAGSSCIFEHSDFRGNLDLDGDGSFSFGGDLHLEQNCQISSSPSELSSFIWENGVNLQGDGKIIGDVHIVAGDIHPSGVWVDGNLDLGHILIEGSYAQSEGTAIHMDVNGVGHSDRFEVIGDAFINGGTLQVEAGGVGLNQSERVTLISGTPLRGDFQELNLPDGYWIDRNGDVMDIVVGQEVHNPDEDAQIIEITADLLDQDGTGQEIEFPSTYGTNTQLLLKVMFDKPVIVREELIARLNTGASVSVQHEMQEIQTHVAYIPYIIQENESCECLTLLEFIQDGNPPYALSDPAGNMLDGRIPEEGIPVTPCIGANFTSEPPPPTIDERNILILRGDVEPGIFGIGDRIPIFLQFEGVQPQIILQLQLNTSQLVELSPNGNTEGSDGFLGFYQVAEGEETLNLEAEGLFLNAQALELELPTLGHLGDNAEKGIQIDGIRPRLIAANSHSPNGTYHQGERIELGLEFSEPINLTGNMLIQLNTGAELEIGDIKHSREIRFSYEIGEGERIYDLDIDSVQLIDGAQLNDNAGNSGTIEYQKGMLSDFSSIQIQERRPVDSGVLPLESPDEPDSEGCSCRLGGDSPPAALLIFSALLLFRRRSTRFSKSP